MNEIGPNDCLRVICHYSAWQFPKCAKPVQSPSLAEPGLPSGGQGEDNDDDDDDHRLLPGLPITVVMSVMMMMVVVMMITVCGRCCQIRSPNGGHESGEPVHGVHQVDRGVASLLQ